MPKFFIKKENISDSKLILTGTDINHIIKVLRKKIGDILEASDGEGFEYKARITAIEEDKILADILEKNDDIDSDIKITLYQSLPKSDKMDIIIQKCTELGISKIIPFISRYTIVVIDQNKEDKKIQRWRKIAQEACKQCRRSTIPQVTEVYDFDKLIDEISNYDLCIMAYEKESIKLKDVLKSHKNAKNIAIIVGPEGGFTEDEVKRVISKDAKTVSLGKRILRTETASMALLSIITYELEDVQ